MSLDQTQPTAPKRRQRVEGAKNHYLTYIVSILLTMLAFGAVLFGGMTKAFLLPFLVGLAAVQVIFQLAYWMHMKDRGHVYAIIGIAFGFIIALTGVAAAVYWVWW